MRRIRFHVSYDGTDFHGWQVQPGLPTIQGTLESAIETIEGAPVHVEASGRTDAGAHAFAQVAAVSISNRIAVDNFRRAVNRLLPPTIRISEAAEVDLQFHPRFHCTRKTYEYRIFRDEICPPFERRFVYHHPYPLDEAAMTAAAALYEGEHDFSSFAASDESDTLGRSKVRVIFRSSLERHGPKLIYRVTGSGFLKHMVRNMTGVLLEVGKHNIDESGIRLRLSQPRTIRSGPTAPASGLFLVSVDYE
ncbi:MAG: tRNA pseudouridine(38-40) synthase TruA [Bryobacteraceae bacterium]